MGRSGMTRSPLRWPVVRSSGAQRIMAARTLRNTGRWDNPFTRTVGRLADLMPVYSRRSAARFRLGPLDGRQLESPDRSVQKHGALEFHEGRHVAGDEPV